MITFPDGSTCNTCGSLMVRLRGRPSEKWLSWWHCPSCGDNDDEDFIAHARETRERCAFALRLGRFALVRKDRIFGYAVAKEWRPLFWRIWIRR
jgi:hypothetical protein